MGSGRWGADWPLCARRLSAPLRCVILYVALNTCHQPKHQLPIDHPTNQPTNQRTTTRFVTWCRMLLPEASRWCPRWSCRDTAARHWQHTPTCHVRDASPHVAPRVAYCVLQVVHYTAPHSLAAAHPNLLYETTPPLCGRTASVLLGIAPPVSVLRLYCLTLRV